MRFETIRVEDAVGAILAHGIQHGEARFKKGRVLTAADTAALAAAGVSEVTVAQLDADDVPEDEAAALLAEALAGDGVRVASAFTGRANLYATVPGVFTVKAEAIDAINAVDEAITVATLPAFDEVMARAMLATIKIIPYAVKRASLNATLALARALGPVMEVSPYRPLRVGLVSTSLPQTKASIHAKNRATLEARLAAARAPVVADEIVPHEAGAVGDAVRRALAAKAELVLIYSASAIADRRDVVPDGIVRAGGEVLRFGMPVDPGNLLLLARKGEVPVVGLPGCARSPKMNGFDWVLQRLLAGLPVSEGDVGRMGVGGLLKEIPSRPQPRDKAAPAVKSAARIAAVVLAAGQSRRMGAPKQLAVIGGMPMLRRTVEQVRASGVDEIVVVTGHEAEAVGTALKGLPVTLVRNPDYALGLSTSLKAGLAALDEDVDGALIVLGDMPGVGAGDIDRMLAAFDPAEGRGIVVPVHAGKRGNPVLWAAAYFPEMARVSGDTGAKHLLAEFAEAVCEVELGDGVLTDIDTPEQLKAFTDARA
ncbi:MAG: molybdopterin-binding/glycosyltransferase family 2 protein [Alphaproteobacteria bacterium]|nr:molybdopterin-binding/glycosyltransferase family 2 protein [Alphaproteobacteria bacterium]